MDLRRNNTDPENRQVNIHLANTRNRHPITRGQDMYNLLIDEAASIPGGDESIVKENIKDIEWLDQELLKEGIHFLNRHFTLAVLADTFALMFGFSVKPMSAVVLRTGKLTNSEKSFKRYLSTVQRTARFFMLPVDEQMSRKAFYSVRNLHVKFRNVEPEPLEIYPEPWKLELAKAMRLDLESLGSLDPPTNLLTWNPKCPLSQFDMAVTQFGFIGVMWLFPHTFGIQNRDKELRGVIHLWAVIGRQLGLRDEYNVCLANDPVVFETLYQNVLLESLKTMDTTAISIQHEFMKALTTRVPFMTHKAMLFYGLQEVNGYKGENLWRLMTFWDKFSFKFLQLWFWGMRKSVVYRFLMNIQTGLWLQWQLWRNDVPTLLAMGIRNLFKVLRM